MKKLTLLCTVLITAATQARSAAPTSTAEQPAHTTRPNTFMIQSYQAGSTTEIDDLKIIDLDSGVVVYENTFSAPSDATRALNSYYWPEGGKDTENYVKNGPKTRVENGKFILETTGFDQNGSGGYESHSEVEFSEKLPVNFRVEFTARRLQWPGHFHFMLYRQEPDDAVGAQTLGGSFSSQRPNKRPLDMIRMAASGDWFQKLGILTNFGTPQQAWSQTFPAPSGSLEETHQLAVELKNNKVSFFMDNVLLQDTQVAGWEVDAGSKAPMPTQAASGGANTAGGPLQKIQRADKSRQWSPEQATGVPDTNTAGDLPTAWASMNPDAGPEWLEVEFAKPVEIAEVRIRETFNPGAISKVEATSIDNKGTVIWEGTAEAKPAPSDMVVKPQSAIVSNKIKIHLDTTRVPGWNEIDAVELLGKDGSRQWAQSATASSTYADARPQKPAPNTQQASMPQKFDLNDLIGDNLIDANGNPIDSATLKNKFIGIYFSAHWCGPCRQFTPKLVEFRNQIADEFEVVFASADQDAPAMLSYMKEAAMPWPALPFASPKISSLNRAFQIRSIPTFVVLDPTGRLASPNARNDVTTLSPKDALSKWKIDAEKAAPPKPALVPPPILSSTSENPPKDISIVPGKSLLGCPIESTEEEVVKKLGKPMANFWFGENATALMYYNGTALLRFHNGKLLDGNFSGSSQLRINHFHKKEAPAYSLPNGIAIGTDLQELKDVLGNKVDIKKLNESSNLSYLDEGLMIKLKYTKYTTHINGNTTIEYKIDSIQIENPNSPFGFKSIEPGKSIFGCPLGASEAEIIKILGEPQGKIDLGPNKIGLLYDNFSNLLILWDGVLGGGAFQSGRIFQNDLYLGNNMVTLTNGVALKTSLAKAKEILGEKLDISKSMHEATYQAGDSLISLISYSHIPDGVSHEEAAKDINNYTIHSIKIDPISKAQPVSPSTGCAIPKKTTFPARQNPEAFNPAEMVAVEGGTLSEKSNLPGVKVDSFFIGKYEVTNAEWHAIQTFAQMNGYSFSKEPRTDHPEMPVEGVTRREAMLWCNAKSEKEGRKPVYWLNGKIYKSPDQEPEMNLDADGYRLPTEPEWEWAARGGIQSKGYEFSGSNIQNEVAWHGDDGEKWARLVGTKKPNELGIHDMSGNVYEWVWDINIPTHGIQGGSYMSGKWHLILNHRNSSPLRDFANEVGSARSLGFRVARNHSKETKPPITPVSYQTIPDHSASGPEQPTVPKVDLLSLIGKELINAAGEPVDPNTFQNKMIALYFSAHWCGPCRGFTPKLVDLANKHKDDLTVVFLSSDKSAEAMLTYMNESKMPWPAIPFESENIQKLKEVLKVKSIPTLVILNPSGNLLTADGRNDVGNLTPEKCIAKWKSSQPLELSKLSKIQAPPIFQRSPPPRPKDITIDPGKSIFGCAYGSSEDDVINKLGTPLGRSEFESGVTGLIYGIDCLLYLKNGGLVGASLNHDSNYAILNRFSYSSPQQYFNNISTGGWRLSNGIHPKMAFQDAKKILGSQIALNEANPQFEINNQVIMFSSSNRNNFHLIESLMILPKELKEGIKLKQQSSELEITTINPGRIFLGCKWGSGPQEIIQTLGNPNAIFDLGENKKGYSYKNNLLILWDEKLAGCHLTNPGTLTLPNGVRLGMPLQEAIAIIGDKLIEPKKITSAKYPTLMDHCCLQ